MLALSCMMFAIVAYNLLIVILVPAVQNRTHSGCQESGEIHWPTDEAHGVKRSNSCKIDTSSNCDFVQQLLSESQMMTDQCEYQFGSTPLMEDQSWSLDYAVCCI